MEFSRRQVLVASLAVPVLGWVNSGFRSLPAASQATMHEVGAREVRYFSSDFTTIFRLKFPGAIEVDGASASRPRVLNISATADPRVVRSTDAVSPASLGDTAFGVLTDGENTVADYRATLSSQSGDWKDVAVALPFVTLPLYPSDGIDEVSGIDFDVNSTQKGGIASTSRPELLLTDGLAWGAILNVGWANTRPSGKEGIFSYPSFVRCTSVGPGAIPAGARFTIVADKRCLATLSAVRTGMPVDTVFSDFYSETQSESGDALQTEITILSAVPAGQNVRVNLNATFAGEPAPIARETTVKFIAPEAGRDWQRHTQGEVARNSKTAVDASERVTRGNR